MWCWVLLNWCTIGSCNILLLCVMGMFCTAMLVIVVWLLLLILVYVVMICSCWLLVGSTPSSGGLGVSIVDMFLGCCIGVNSLEGLLIWWWTVCTNVMVCAGVVRGCWLFLMIWLGVLLECYCCMVRWLRKLLCRNDDSVIVRCLVGVSWMCMSLLFGLMIGLSALCCGSRSSVLVLVSGQLGVYALCCVCTGGTSGLGVMNSVTLADVGLGRLLVSARCICSNVILLWLSSMLCCLVMLSVVVGVESTWWSLGG